VFSKAADDDVIVVKVSSANNNKYQPLSNLSEINV